MTKVERNPKGEGRIGNGRDLPADYGPRAAFVLRGSSFVVRRRGFTLLELLLAVLVFSIVLGAIHVVFFSAFKLRNKTSDSLERAMPLEQTLTIIKRDLSNLVPPGGTFSGALQSTPTISTSTGSLTGSSGSSSSAGSGSGGMSGFLNRGNGPDFYTAVGIVDDTAPWGEIERVSYYLATPTNNAPGQDLYRSVSRNLLPTTSDQPDDQFLMSGVDSITFRYFNGTTWQDTWDSTREDTATGLTNNLPTAIKLELQLHYEDNTLGQPAPVELIVPVMVLARTNLTAAIE